MYRCGTYLEGVCTGVVHTRRFSYRCVTLQRSMYRCGTYLGEGVCTGVVHAEIEIYTVTYLFIHTNIGRILVCIYIMCVYVHRTCTRCIQCMHSSLYYFFHSCTNSTYCTYTTCTHVRTYVCTVPEIVTCYTHNPYDVKLVGVTFIICLHKR